MLAHMLSTDRNALVCDMAETYHIYDLRTLPARLAASLACGLREGSRIMQKLSGAKATKEILLMALIADELGILCWQNTEDGHKGLNPPKSIYESIVGKKQEQAGFDTPEEFMAWRESMLEG